jgi:hypothetical protein
MTKPPMPREHGAWGILLIPFTTAVGVSGMFDLKIALLLVSILCFYVARTSYLKQNLKWTTLLLAGSVVCVAPLLFVWRLWWLIAFGAVAAPLAFRKTERSVDMQLVAVAGLTLTAPAAWYVATSQIDRRAWLLWLLNVLYFAGGVFYVKMHIAAAMAGRAIAPHPDPLPASGERGEQQSRTLPARTRLRLGAPTLGVYTALPVVLFALVWSGAISCWVTLAYAPVVVRAVAGVWRLSPSLRIKRLGWTEVAYSIVFAVILIATLR